MLSDLQLVYMGPRNSTKLLKINTTKFQVEREPVYNFNFYHINDIIINIHVNIEYDSDSHTYKLLTMILILFIQLPTWYMAVGPNKRLVNH